MSDKCYSAGRLLTVFTLVIGKSQSRLGFKSRFEPLWRIELCRKDLIWTDTIRFAIRFKNFEIRFEKYLNHGKSQDYLLTDFFQTHIKTNSDVALWLGLEEHDLCKWR